MRDKGRLGEWEFPKNLCSRWVQPCPAPCTPYQRSIPWLKEGWRQMSYSAYCMHGGHPYLGLDSLIWVCPWMHPKTCHGRGSEFFPLLLFLQKTTLLGQRIPVGLQKGRPHSCCPGLLILSPVMHRDPLQPSSAILPAPLFFLRVCAPAERKKGKIKWKGGKNAALVIIYYYECKVLNFWYLVSFLLSWAIPHNKVQFIFGRDGCSWAGTRLRTKEHWRHPQESSSRCLTSSPASGQRYKPGTQITKADSLACISCRVKRGWSKCSLPSLGSWEASCHCSARLWLTLYVI